MTESWRTIPDYPAYTASSLGRIRRRGIGRNGPYRCLKPRERTGGLQVGLRKKGRTWYRSPGWIVSSAFRPAKRRTHLAIHLDRDIWNNELRNLCWATPREVQMMFPQKCGSAHPDALFTEREVVTIRSRLLAGEKTTDLAEEYGAADNTISALGLGTHYATDGGPLSRRSADKRQFGRAFARVLRRRPRRYGESVVGWCRRIHSELVDDFPTTTVASVGQALRYRGLL